MTVPGYPEPGTPVTSADGKLTAVPHKGFPGVLLCADFLAGETDRSFFERAIDGSDEWEPVRSGWPARLYAATRSECYDVEALPGVPVSYRLSTSAEMLTGGSNRTVTVTLPDLADCEAWLKHLGSPTLSRQVRIMEWSEGRESWLRTDDVEGVPARFVVDAPTVRLATGSMTLRVYSETDYLDLTRLLSTSGPLLLQAGPGHGLHDLYLVREGWPVDRPRRDGWHIRDLQVAWLEIPRPDDFDAPPVIPGWTWDEYTRGQSMAALSSAYADQRALMLDGVRQWSPRRGGLRGRRP